MASSVALMTLLVFLFSFKFSHFLSTEFLGFSRLNLMLFSFSGNDFLYL